MVCSQHSANNSLLHKAERVDCKDLLREIVVLFVVSQLYVRIDYV
jgi:hypothetical protein